MRMKRITILELRNVGYVQQLWYQGCSGPVSQRVPGAGCVAVLGHSSSKTEAPWTTSQQYYINYGTFVASSGLSVIGASIPLYN